MTDLAVGVDFGGTKVLAAVVNVKTGKVVGTGKKRTSSTDGPNELMKRIYGTIDGALADANVKIGDISGIGVGIAGQVDATQGLLIGTANLSRAVVNLPMAKRLEDRFSVPASIRNDVQIAAIGEASFGAGHQISDFLCVLCRDRDRRRDRDQWGTGRWCGWECRRARTHDRASRWSDLWVWRTRSFGSLCFPNRDHECVAR